MREGARPYSRGAVIEPIPKALLDSSVADIQAQWILNEEIRNRPPGWKPPKKKGERQEAWRYPSTPYGIECQLELHCLLRGLSRCVRDRSDEEEGGLAADFGPLQVSQSIQITQEEVVAAAATRGADKARCAAQAAADAPVPSLQGARPSASSQRASWCVDLESPVRSQR